jgi:dienelactone hydrolase
LVTKEALPDDELTHRRVRGGYSSICLVLNGGAVKLIIKAVSKCFAILATSFAAICNADPGPADVAKSWENARVYIPGQESFATSPKDVKFDKSAPVVLFMHGCSGIEKTDIAWADFLKEKGYFVVLPNSFARDRPASCDPRTQRAGLFPAVAEFRLDEARYSMERLKELAWADKANLFLMGHSEGAAIAALSDSPGYRGVIVSAWICTSLRFPKNSGIRVPTDTALLILDHESDPWYPYGPNRHCSEYFGARTNAQQLTLPGTMHETFVPEAQKTLADFLAKNIVR